MKIEDIILKKDWKFAIIWYGKEGQSSLRFLLKLGIKNITIHDQKTIENKEKNIKYIEGEGYLSQDTLKTYDIIIKSPGISPYLNDFLWLENKITTQTEIFINNYKWKIIWITWTKWKSTTSTLTTLSLENAWYKVKLVWNIWSPVLDEIDILSNELYDYVIYEMSSYMLEWIKAKLYIWYLNNLYDCHLDWHKWKGNYTNAKLNILKDSNHKIANIETKSLTKDINWIVYFWEGSNILYKDNFFFLDWEKIIKDENILLKWNHNRTNISWIIAILWALIKDWEDKNKLIESVKITMSSFSWLANRIEDIWTFKWITFINDAMATTPESTIAAINTFGEKIWTLILWWYNSWFCFDELINTIKKYKIDNLILLPDTWEIIFWDLSQYNYETKFEINLWNYKPKIFKTKDIKNAVNFAYKNTSKWKIVLLSTAAPFLKVDNKWESYLVKAELFKKYTKELLISR